MEYSCPTTRSNARSADFFNEPSAARNEFEPPRPWYNKKQDKKTPFPVVSASSPKEITTEGQNSGMTVERQSGGKC
jgi:hypothetical protein